MSQATPIIGPNKSGLSYRQEDNDGKKALLNHHKGSTAPSYAEAGMLWLDDAATPWALKLYDGADWLTVMQLHAGNNTVLPYLGAAPLRVPILASDTGSANAYAVAPTPAIGSYAAGVMALLRPSVANTGASTLAMNGLSAVAIKMPDGTDTPADVLKTSGAYLLLHNGTHFCLLNPSAAQNSGCLQSLATTFTSTSTTVNSIPMDDTIPTSSEGVEIMSISITPKSATSRMVIRAQGIAGHASAGYLISGIFINSASAAHYSNSDAAPATNASKASILCTHSPGSTAPVTYKLRIGGSGGGIRYNGSYSGRVLGGSCYWLMTVEEYQ